MKPRYDIGIVLHAPRSSPREKESFLLAMDEATMTFCISSQNPQVNDTIPEGLTEWGAEERQGPISIKIVKFLYKGIKTSKEVKDAEQERIQGILDMLVKTALPD